MRIAIVGHFGGNESFNDGQTVKTIAIHDALKRYGIQKIDRIDTFYIRRNILRFILQFGKSIVLDKKFIVLLSDKGRKALFPVFYGMSKIGKEVYHYGIGGRLAREVRENKKWKKYVSSFKGNWLESIELAEALQKQGVNNAIYLPNFKKLNILPKEDLRKEYSIPYKLCTFSRVMEEKGIEDAIAAVQKINNTYGKQIVALNIYGPIDKRYVERFKDVLKNADSCTYCGVIDADKSVEAIKDNFLLLFPTHWRHEGIPGTVIDGMSAGLPVVARRWQYCDEMIRHGYNGYSYDFDKPEMLMETIIFAINHLEETIQMKANCIEKAYEYSEERVIREIVNQLGI